MTIFRVARWLILAGLMVAVLLMLSQPAPITRPIMAAALANNARSFQQKLSELARAKARGESRAEVRVTAGEVGAARSQEGASSAPAYQLNFENDVARGQFAMELKGKQLYVTVAGHLGARDGYVTFSPTEFKIGRLRIPVSMVNSRLQRKLLEQREKLKLPDFVSDLRVERGELVIRQH